MITRRRTIVNQSGQYTTVLTTVFNEVEYEKLVVTNPTYKIQISSVDDDIKRINLLMNAII